MILYVQEVLSILFNIATKNIKLTRLLGHIVCIISVHYHIVINIIIIVINYYRYYYYRYQYN